MKAIPFNENFFHRYLRLAPIPLALERSIECEILAQENFERPVLDIGCGEGIFAHVLFQDKVDCGLDPNPTEISKAHDYESYTELVRCFGHEIPKKSSSFQTIFSNSVLEHIPDILPVLKEAHRILKPQGNFYVTVPTNYFRENYILSYLFKTIGLSKLSEKIALGYNQFWAHYHDHPIPEWIDLFNESGFTLVKHTPYCPPRTALLNDFFTPLSLYSFLCKRIFNKWNLNTPLHRIKVKLAHKALVHLTSPLNQSGDGCICFFHLTK